MRIANAVCTLSVCKDIASEVGRHLKPNVSVSSFCEGDNFERCQSPPVSLSLSPYPDAWTGMVHRPRSKEKRKQRR